MNTPKVLFGFFSTDEMRHPHETAVGTLGLTVKWFPTWEELLAAGPGAHPLAVVVDLDALPKPGDERLEALKAAYPQTELIGLSSSDSATDALKAIRSGLADYLVKPASPEEVAWSVKRAQQRQEMMSKIEGPRTRLIRALTQISSSTSPWLLRLCTLEFLQQTLHAEGAAWIGPKGEPLCAVPRKNQGPEVRQLFPKKTGWRQGPRARIFKNGNERKLYLPFPDPKAGGAFLWGLAETPDRRRMGDARMLVEHAQVCLANLEKFEEIKQRTYVDDLTGLYNSRYLRYALTNAIVRSSQNARHFAVLFIDVDHFKKINDTHGHLVGSEFLVAIAKAIKNTVRRIDPVFRYGGDEFVVILHDTTKDGARHIAERIRKQIERRVFRIQDKKIQTTVSVGVAVYPDHTMERDTLIRLADTAMYEVKRDSRNAVHMAFGEGKDTPPPPEAEA